MARTKRDESEVEFGRRLSRLLANARIASSKSVQEVADAIGTSRDGLYAVEAGRVLSPSFRTVYLLSREYRMDVGDLARRADAGAS